MKKWMAIMLLIALALFGSVIGFNMFKQEEGDSWPIGPSPSSRSLRHGHQGAGLGPTIEAIGFIEPNQGSPLQRAVRHHRQHPVRIGAHVKADQLLLSLDSSVEKSQSELSRPGCRQPGPSSERHKNLYQKNSISRDQLDDAEASYRSLEADIDSLKATIARREVRAPFSGAVGLRNVFLGQYLEPGTQIVRSGRHQRDAPALHRAPDRHLQNHPGTDHQDQRGCLSPDPV